MDFIAKMKSLPSNKLIEVLQKRNDYQPEAVDAAIKEAIERGLLSLDESISKFDLVSEKQVPKKSLDINDYVNNSFTAQIRNLHLTKWAGLFQFFFYFICTVISAQVLTTYKEPYIINSKYELNFSVLIIIMLFIVGSLFFYYISLLHVFRRIPFNRNGLILFKWTIKINIILSSLFCVAFALSTAQLPAVFLGLLIFINSLVYTYRINTIFFMGTTGRFYNSLRIVLIVIFVIVFISLALSYYIAL